MACTPAKAIIDASGLCVVGALMGGIMAASKVLSSLGFVKIMCAASTPTPFPFSYPIFVACIPSPRPICAPCERGYYAVSGPGDSMPKTTICISGEEVPVEGKGFIAEE